MRCEGASRRFSGITGLLVEAAVLGALGRVGRKDVTLPDGPAGLEDALCCGVVGNDERIRGVPLMA